jgi:hypothetical protein
VLDGRLGAAAVVETISNVGIGRIASRRAPGLCASDAQVMHDAATPLYEGGPGGQASVMAVALAGGFEQGSSLYRLLRGRKRWWEFAPGTQFLVGRQAARGSVALAGAKGWLRLSMCQIA